MPDDPKLQSMAEATDPTKQAGGDVPEKKADSTPTPPAIDQKAFDTMKDEHSKLTKFVEVLTAKGITSSEDLEANLSLVAQINKNSEMKGIIGDLLSGKGAKVDPTPTPDPTKMDAAGVSALIKEQIAEAIKADRTERATHEFNQGSAVENALKARVLADSRFKKIMGDVDFDKAMKGDGSKAAQLVAIAADHLFFEAGSSATPNGQYAPVTSEASVKGIADRLVEMFTEVKAQAIMDASSDPGTVDNADAPKPGEAPGEGVRQVPIGDQFDWPSEEGTKDADAVGKTFEAAYRRAKAQQEKLSASQQV